MLDKMKYIVYDGELADTIVIFPDFEKHDQMAQRLGLAPSNILSAGFFQIINGEPQCYGSSFSLNISSRETDTKMVRDYLGLNG